MKKLMSIMLGLSLLVGTTALFAQDKADTTKTEKKKKSKGSKAKKSKESTEKKS